MNSVNRWQRLLEKKRLLNMKSENKMNVKNIIIVGGGTSAWLSAAYLSHNLKNAKITVIDKEIGKPVGVGEGTILNFGPFLKYCGLDEKDWFNKINATYKAGILFKDWQRDNEDIWHGFYYNPRLYKNNTLYDCYTHNKDYSFKDISPLCNLSLKNKIDLQEMDCKFTEEKENYYAYHVDASQLTIFLQDYLKDKVEFIGSEVVDIQRNEDNVTGLKLKNGQSLNADLYIDCTGWRSILSYAPLKVSLKNRLFADTAIASRIPYLDKDKENTPYVQSNAVEHGWMWIIPTQQRIGSGLVFNRSVTEVDEAKEWFKKFWSSHKTEWEDPIKVLDWTPQYKENMWEGNVVSVGLSAGFIEPLESTGIGMIMEGIVQLYAQIQDYNFDENKRKDYNSICSEFFENSIDFINMHYTKIDRSTKFWDYVKEMNTGPNKLKDLFLGYMNDPHKTMVNTEISNDFFTTNSWYTWLFQLGYDFKSKELDITPEQSRDLIERYYKEVESVREKKETVLLHNTHITKHQNI
jgi:flavin-dependent dehydrogenase